MRAMGSLNIFKVSNHLPANISEICILFKSEHSDEKKKK